MIEIGDQDLRDLCGKRYADGDRRKQRGPETVGFDDPEQPELKTEKVDQKQADDEIGCRQEQGREGTQQSLSVTLRHDLRAVGDRKGEDQRHGQPGGGQDQRRWQHLGDERRDRSVGAHRDAQIACQEGRQGVPELHDDRLVQPLCRNDFGNLLLGKAVLRVAQNAGDRVARQDADDHEGEDIGQKDDDDRLAEPLCGVG